MKQGPVFLLCALAIPLAGCAVIQRGMQAQNIGARFATTPEEAPVARFDAQLSATSQLIADWCSDAEWTLEAQSDDSVACTTSHRRTTSRTLPGQGTVFDRYTVTEWATFTFVPRLDRTCVLVAVEVERDDLGRRTGSYTDLEEVLVELGGRTAPEDKAICAQTDTPPAVG